MPRTKSKFIFLAAFLLLLFANRAAAAPSGEGCQDCRRDVEFLSGPLCEGRESGTRGFVEAQAYVARRFCDIEGIRGVQVQSFLSADSVAYRNTLAFLPSTTPGKPRSYIIVTAFLDGFGKIDGKVYPGADSNASGVAAMLGIAGRLAAAPVRPGALLFVALDGHRANSCGAASLCSLLASGGIVDPISGTPVRPSQVSLVVNLDIVGSSLAPVVKYNKEYLIALGGAGFSTSMERCNAPYGLHLTYDYYGSPDFTNLFYRRVGDQRFFLQNGYRCVVFTSGITMLTNKPGDSAETLDYPLLEKRIDFISSWLATKL